MLQEAKELQNNAVTQLERIIYTKKEITFKSPTGSGKTRMMSDFMNRILEKDNDVIFIVSTLSKGGLSEQNYENFKKYSNFEFKKLNPFLISSENSGENKIDIDTGYNVYVLPRDLYKKNSKLKDQGIFEDFLRNFKFIMASYPKQIYLIKDECHIATNNLDELVKKMYFDKIINFSATPNKKQYPDIQITEGDAVRTRLIKAVEYRKEELEKALDKFMELRDEYTSKIGINPCMIIQISNQKKAEEELNEIKKDLSKGKFKDLKWMYITNETSKCDTNDNFKAKKLPIQKWKGYAKDNDSLIDIIIFKMVISEGWDIPRACMLYQMRDTHSEQLTEQVIGRVRRNPKLQDYVSLSDEQKDLIDKAYVYSVEHEEKNIIYVKLRESAKNQIEIKTTRLPETKKAVTISEVEDVLKDKTILASKNIFDLYRDYTSNSEIQALCDEYIGKDVQKWVKFVSNKQDIEKLLKNTFKNYKNMYINKDSLGNDILATLPSRSINVSTLHCRNISEWIWLREDGDDTFHFDSKAEENWIRELLKIAKVKNSTGDYKISWLKEGEEEYFLIAKNFLENSQIYFEYYNYGIHKSYPDFVLKDSKGGIHIFEIKSLNSSNHIDINSEEYKEKVEILLEFYTHVSELLEYKFYIPIQIGKGWTIYELHEGNKKIITLEELKNNLN